ADARAAPLATSLSGRDDFPASVADSLAAIAARDAVAYETAIGALLSDFEQRDEFLEDVAVADTVLVLQLLAEPRELVVELESPLLPAAPALS
ncbi:MAG TPA: hypothetical protein VK926_03820, partial [Gaiellaceae bacterium]|nr:hypothetical protein [Gaiellaceae bacterium]